MYNPACLNDPQPPIVTSITSKHIEDDSVTESVDENETNVPIDEGSSNINTDSLEEDLLAEKSHDNYGNETDPQDEKDPLGTVVLNEAELSVFNEILNENDDCEIVYVPANSRNK